VKSVIGNNTSVGKRDQNERTLPIASASEPLRAAALAERRRQPKRWLLQ
jgi:hypothetical protein